MRKGARKARSGYLFSSLGLPCKRVARCYDHIGTGVSDTVFRIVIRAEIPRDEYKRSFLDELSCGNEANVFDENLADSLVIDEGFFEHMYH